MDTFLKLACYGPSEAKRLPFALPELRLFLNRPLKAEHKMNADSDARNPPPTRMSFYVYTQAATLKPEASPREPMTQARTGTKRASSHLKLLFSLFLRPCVTLKSQG
jgi:hypothetical protein